MSDHYCCSRCHLRYDDCRCLPVATAAPAKPWGIDRNLTVVLADNVPFLRLASFDRYATHAEALAVARELIAKRISDWESELFWARKAREAMK